LKTTYENNLNGIKSKKNIVTLQKTNKKYMSKEVDHRIINELRIDSFKEISFQFNLKEERQLRASLL